ncbi:MAG: glyoxylate/hydroxypyruvate reductase A [Hyphomicrobiales bacterium]|nr:MAG: glyoxylate/hydroxypyruvate reductase A [Hyphomicrobiales bacterium]
MSKGTILLDTKLDLGERKSIFIDAFSDRKVIDLAASGNQGLSDVRYALAWLPEHGLLKSLPKLEVIFSLGAGVDHILSDPDLPNVPLVRFVDPDLTGRMAEYVAMHCLLHLRQHKAYDDQQKSHIWCELLQPCAPDMSVGIMGFGLLGQAAAERLLPLGFNVNGWARSEKIMPGVTTYQGDDQLNAFLNDTDILVNLLPYTPQTHGILNRDLCQRLSRDGPFGAPVVINAGRGKSQNSEELLSCLTDGTLHGASLDVFEIEPLGPKSRLWDLDNVYVTPHVAATTSPQSLARYVVEQIARYENGQGLQNIVDPRQGY